MCLLGAVVFAQPVRALTRPDAAFTREAAEGNLAQIAYGRLALERSNREGVRALAERLISDHQLLNDELKALLEGSSFRFPVELGPAAREHLATLRAASETAFDAAFVEHVVKTHERSVELFKSQLRSAQLPSLRDFAKAALPVLEAHLRTAKELTKTRTTSR